MCPNTIDEHYALSAYVAFDDLQAAVANEEPTW